MHAASILLSLCPSASVPLAARDGHSDLYTRVVERAVERTQKEVLRATDLWVDHSRWENPWIVESAHYEVRTTHSRFLAAYFAQNLEHMYAEFEKLLGSVGPPPRKFRVWIFPDLAAYNAFGEQRGAEHSSMYGSFHAADDPERPVATYFHKNRTHLGMWITHGAAHQFVEQMFPGALPLWIGEGLASYFALYWDWQYGARELRRLIETQAYVPLQRLTRDPIANYVGSADARFVELGMLFHYLLDHRDDTKTVATESGDTGVFRDFLRALVRRQDLGSSVFARESLEDLARIEQDFKAFDFGAP